MPSERIQRRVDRLLDEAEAAADRKDWPRAAEIAREVVELDPENEDAPVLLRAAGAMLGPAAAVEGAPAAAESRPASVEQPSSFVAGRYAVRRFLGEGGKKRVYLAHDERLDRDVAFALIKTEGLDEVGRERITREAQAMGRLGAHPHVVTIFEIGEESGAPYVVTELLGGGDVEGLLAEGPLPLARTLGIAKGVARGLAFAHQQGVVHRDLKPGNVWLTSSGPDGVAKIGDFGLAVALDRSRLTTHGLMVGTVAYMPPEQALGGEVTPHADLYSLGAMLYELVTGKPPFGGDSPTAIISQHINTPPVAPSWHSEHCPPDLEALILKLLAKVPADRPASALEVLAALEAVDPEAPSVRHSDSSANPLDRLARGVFVGRERELERLKSAFDEAFAGRGSVVMLVGEPGIGKTRTVQELSTYARMRGAKVLWGRAHEASGAPPYWPWVQVGRDYAAQTESEALTRQLRDHALELQRLFPGIKERFPGLPDPPPADSEETQFQLFDALSSFFRAVSVETPLVLVLDDLHWADRSTLRMLTHLAREVGMSRLLVTGTYRDTDLDRAHPLSQALAELNREDLFTRILLRGLTEPETAAYIRDTAQSEPPAELVRRVHAETEGNPFFLSEVVRLMAEEGAFSEGATSEIRIPEGVKEALGRRLDRMSPEANELLSVAAVVGREFDHAQLVAVSGNADDEVLRLVEETLAARVLEETSAVGGYRFTHALMQETLLGELSAARRVRLHGQIAEALNTHYGDTAAAHAPELARHYLESSALNQLHVGAAANYSRMAGEQAMATLAYTEAAGHLRAALDLVDANLPPLVRARLKLGLGKALLGAANAPAGLPLLEEALSDFEEVGDPPRMAEAVLAMAPAAAAGDQGKLQALAARVLPLLADSDPWLKAQVALVCARGRSTGDDWRVETAGQAAAAAEARRLADLADLSDVKASLLLRSANQALRVDRELGRRLFQEALAAFEEARDFAGMGSATWSLAVVANTFDEMIEGLAEAAHLRTRAGLTRLAYTHVALRAIVLIQLRGDVQSALNSIEPLRLPFYLLEVVRALALELDGQAAAALACLDRFGAEEIAPILRPAILALRARLLGADGHVDEARVIAAEASAGVRSLLSPGADMWALLLGVDALSQLLSAEDFVPFIEKFRRDLESDFQWPIDVICAAGMPARIYALGALARGDLEECERLLQTAVSASLGDDLPIEAGRCHQGLADVADRRGDVEAARTHLDAAGVLFAKHGAKRYLDQVLAKKQILKT